MSLPLSGLKVIDFATVFAGPFTAQMLGDQGANIVKLEPPDGGDSARRLTPGVGMPDLSLGFLAFNRNKRSVTIDITKPEGKEAAYRLIRWADVLIINMRVDTRRRRGFTYEQLAAINPRLIYVSLTGYGDDGPDADLPGLDIVIQGRIGDIEGRTEPGKPPPRHTMLFHFDMATSMLASYAVMLALRDRERTGLGQKIDTSLLQTGVQLHAAQMTRVVDLAARYPTRATGLPIIYRCADGRYILDMYINIGPRWSEICSTLGRADLMDDPRFATPEERAKHVDVIEEIVAQHFLTRPAAEWETIFKTAGHTNSVVKVIEEVFDDPQIVANQMIAQFEQPGVGDVQAVGRPFRMSASADDEWIRRPTPHLGEHTDEVLQELGYTPEEIAGLHAVQAVG